VITKLGVMAALVSVALVGAYIALGGTEYRPTPVADPCKPRAATSTGKETSEVLQRVVLTAADETACELGVSREELVLAMRGSDELERLAEEENLDPDRIEQGVRAGLVRAVDQAQEEELLGDRTAGLVRAAAERLPLGLLLALLRGASGLLDG
jgi:hypothetical protein